MFKKLNSFNKVLMQQENVVLCDDKCCRLTITPYQQVGNYIFRKNARKAGIFIYDPVEKRVLLVQSRGHLWGPPKGSMELNENIQNCAIRETKEETGLIITESQFISNMRISRAVYFYVNISMCDVNVQDWNGNDANGIAWIKLDCLKKLMKNETIRLNRHCVKLLSNILNFDVTDDDDKFIEDKFIDDKFIEDKSNDKSNDKFIEDKSDDKSNESEKN